jgi:ornithine carbamoyltransferase
LHAVDDSMYDGKNKMSRNILSITDLDLDTLARLVSRAADFAAGGENGVPSFTGRCVGLLFRRPSTRTRTSFTRAAMRLGAGVIAYGPHDLQLTTGESLEDTSRVLSEYLDVLVIRTNDSIEEMERLATQSKMGVINAMSANEHPTQAIADLSTLLEAFGRLDGLHLLYLGEGNNTAAALALAVGLTPGMRLTLFTPRGYGLSSEALQRACQLAGRNGSCVEQEHDLDRLPRGVDVVYTTRWQTMGVPKGTSDWQEEFRPYSVTPELMAKVSKPAGTVFLHDLPAVRGDDVQSEVLDGPQSLAFRQAGHKMFSAMAILEWCLGETG